MRTLIIKLPSDLPNAHLAYSHTVVQVPSDAQALTIEWATANSMPVVDRHTEVVVMVPAINLSWHKVELPSSLRPYDARLQSALQGILEERLLDDVTDLHMALQQDWRSLNRPWVAVCDCQWLTSHLRALEQSGLTVHRIVPEQCPQVVSAPPQITALGDADNAMVWLSHSEWGVLGQPVSELKNCSALLSEQDFRDAEISAEPSVVGLISEYFDRNARLLFPAEHWLAAVHSNWDLAQFSFKANTRTRLLKKSHRGINYFWHASAWKPARWGLWLLLACQLIGLNAWAWKTRTNWQSQQNTWSQILRETFPNTAIVMDAPLQMAQEVERLRKSAGQLDSNDLESMLVALGKSMPQGISAAGRLSFTPGQLRLQDFKLSAVDQQYMQQNLIASGYQLRRNGEAWLVTEKNNTETPR